MTFFCIFSHKKHFFAYFLLLTKQPINISRLFNFFFTKFQKFQGSCRNKRYRLTGSNFCTLLSDPKRQLSRTKAERHVYFYAFQAVLLCSHPVSYILLRVRVRHAPLRTAKRSQKYKIFPFDKSKKMALLLTRERRTQIDPSVGPFDSCDGRITSRHNTYNLYHTCM